MTLTFSPAPHFGASSDPRAYEGRAGHVGNQAPYLLRPRAFHGEIYTWDVLLYKEKPPVGEPTVIAVGLGSLMAARQTAKKHFAES